MTTLSRADVDQLLISGNVEVRASIASEVGRACAEAALDQQSLDRAVELASRLAKDAETGVRRTLAEAIRTSGQIPRELALKLATDVEQVALPVLDSSPVLTSKELAPLVESTSERGRKAIARRKGLGSTVADVLVRVGSSSVVSTLFRNATASIQPATFERALERFPDDEAVQAPMAARDDLPHEMVSRLVERATDRVLDLLANRSDISPTVAARLTALAREKATGVLLGRLETEKRVGRLHREGRLTDEMVLGAVYLGNIDFFEAAIALRAGIPAENARTLLRDSGQLGLQAICGKAGLRETSARSVRRALTMARKLEAEFEPGDVSAFRRRMIEGLLTDHSDLDERSIDFLLDRLAALKAKATEAA